MVRRIASAFMVIGVAACMRPSARPPLPRTSTTAVESIDSMTLNSLRFTYRWDAAQRDSAMRVLASNRAKWRSFRPRTYEYREHAWCFCISMWSGPRLLVIRDQRLVGATDTTGRRTDSTYMKAAAGQVAGIDALFVQIAQGIRDTAWAEVRVAYDVAHGYPTSITYDGALMVSDDELYVNVSHLRALADRSPH